MFDQHGRSPESPAGWRDGGRWRIESLIVTNNAQNAKHHHHNTSLSFTMGKGFGDGGKSGGKGKAGEPKKPVTRSARAGLQVRGGWLCCVDRFWDEFGAIGQQGARDAAACRGCGRRPHATQPRYTTRATHATAASCPLLGARPPPPLHCCVPPSREYCWIFFVGLRHRLTSWLPCCCRSSPWAASTAS
jgi:hypothetical protein